MKKRFICFIISSMILLAMVLTALPGINTQAAEDAGGEAQDIAAAAVGADG